MSSAEAIRILVVDDHPMLRDGIAALIGTQSDLRLVAQASDGAEAVTAFREHQPDVTLLDLRMAGMDGLSAIRAIRSEFSFARIIVLTTYNHGAQAMEAIKAGASAYLLKTMLHTELLDTIRSVHRGQRRIAPEVAVAIAEHAASAVLSRRELDVLELLAEGLSNKEIAKRLSISDETVKQRVSAVMEKLQATSRTQAVTLALKRGLIQLQ